MYIFELCLYREFSKRYFIAESVFQNKMIGYTLPICDYEENYFRHYFHVFPEAKESRVWVAEGIDFFHFDILVPKELATLTDSEKDKNLDSMTVPNAFTAQLPYLNGALIVNEQKA